jgi:hypothetical protein
MRDGKVRVTFEIMDQKDKKDWFGVYLRVGNMGILSASILVYVRKNGQFGIVTYPRFKKLGTKRLRGECAGPKTLLIELEGDHIKANLGGIDLKCSDLDILSPGEVKFASHYCNSKLWDVQMVCRDTIGTFHVLSQ